MGRSMPNHPPVSQVVSTSSTDLAALHGFGGFDGPVLHGFGGFDGPGSEQGRVCGVVADGFGALRPRCKRCVLMGSRGTDMARDTCRPAN